MRLRTLVLTRGQVYPPRSGAALRNWQNINLLAELGPVALFSVDRQRPQGSRHNPPQGLDDVIEHFVTRGNKASLDHLTARFWYLVPRGHPWANGLFDHGGAARLRELMRSFEPDLVVFEEPWLVHYLPAARTHRSRSPKIIYDAHNVEASLRREIASDQDRFGTRSSWQARLRPKRVLALERHLAGAADQVWVCSEEDMATMSFAHPKSSPIAVVPNGVNLDNYKAAKPSVPSENPTLLFVASFGYRPNAKGAEILIESIFPRVQEVFPAARLLLVGRDPTASMKEAAKLDQRIEVTGAVPDVWPFLAAADVVVVPLLMGGGTRIKILEAFASLRPVVATTKAVEGLPVQSDVHLLIRDDPKDLAEAVVSMLRSPMTVAALTSAARSLVEDRYDWKVVGQQLRQAVSHVFADEPDTRSS